MNSEINNSINGICPISETKIMISANRLITNNDRVQARPLDNRYVDKLVVNDTGASKTLYVIPDDYDWETNVETTFSIVDGQHIYTKEIKKGRKTFECELLGGCSKDEVDCRLAKNFGIKQNYSTEQMQVGCAIKYYVEAAKHFEDNVSRGGKGEGTREAWIYNNPEWNAYNFGVNNIKKYITLGKKIYDKVGIKDLTFLDEFILYKTNITNIMMVTKDWDYMNVLRDIYWGDEGWGNKDKKFSDSNKQFEIKFKLASKKMGNNLKVRDKKGVTDFKSIIDNNSNAIIYANDFISEVNLYGHELNDINISDLCVKFKDESGKLDADIKNIKKMHNNLDVLNRQKNKLSKCVLELKALFENDDTNIDTFDDSEEYVEADDISDLNV